MSVEVHTKKFTGGDGRPVVAQHINGCASCGYFHELTSQFGCTEFVKTTEPSTPPRAKRCNHGYPVDLAVCTGCPPGEGGYDRRHP